MSLVPLCSFTEREANPLTPERDLHLISPYNITPELNIKVTRIMAMITT